MSSFTTATLTVPSATPHLRAVRPVPSSTDRERIPAQLRPASPAAQQPIAKHPAPEVRQVLPEHTTVVAMIPQEALPQTLLAQLGAQLGSTSEHPLVGYLVLVQADGPQQPTTAAPLPDDRPARHGISIDTDRRSAHVDGRLLDLTYLEFELLAYLVAHPHRVHTRENLLSAVWGYGHVGDGRTVDVHVARLRRKIGSGYRDGIVTVRRVGYRYTPMS